MTEKDFNNHHHSAETPRGDTHAGVSSERCLPEGKTTAGDGLRIAIIGGGASGFFAAIRVKERLPMAMVDIYERGEKVLAKVAVTGGGRCNLTNSFEHVTDLKQMYPRGHQLMKRLFCRFNHRDTCQWFEKEGVRLVTQEDCCVFPFSQDAMTVVRCLTYKAKGLGIKIHVKHRVTAIERETIESPFQIHFTENKPTEADRVIITTGGSPRADGLAYLEKMGHRIESPVPSLFTFNMEEQDLKQLMGCVVDPVMTGIPATKYKAQGALLITHWGMSGPAVLKLSSHAARFLSENNYHTQVAVNWTGITHSSATSEEVAAIVAANAQKQLASVRPFNLPSRLWLYILAKSGLQQQKRWGELGKKGISRLVETLTNDIHTISGKGRFRDEFVTCGGVSLSSVDMNTLESRVCPHLFFAGEVLDFDAITGGFNLQAAWTMGFVVGRNVVR